MGRSDRRELASRLTVLISHLLKWQAQPDRRSASWLGTIREQRRRIERRLSDSPSLRSDLDQILVEVYKDARKSAICETGRAEDDFPLDIPFATDEILAHSFLPD